MRSWSFKFWALHDHYNHYKYQDSKSNNIVVMSSCGEGPSAFKRDESDQSTGRKRKAVDQKTILLKEVVGVLKSLSQPGGAVTQNQWLTTLDVIKKAMSVMISYDPPTPTPSSCTLIIESLTRTCTHTTGRWRRGYPRQVCSSCCQMGGCGVEG